MAVSKVDPCQTSIWCLREDTCDTKEQTLLRGTELLFSFSVRFIRWLAVEECQVFRAQLCCPLIYF